MGDPARISRKETVHSLSDRNLKHTLQLNLEKNEAATYLGSCKWSISFKRSEAFNGVSK